MHEQRRAGGMARAPRVACRRSARVSPAMRRTESQKTDIMKCGVRHACDTAATVLTSLRLAAAAAGGNTKPAEPPGPCQDRCSGRRAARLVQGSCGTRHDLAARARLRRERTRRRLRGGLTTENGRQLRCRAAAVAREDEGRRAALPCLAPEFTCPKAPETVHAHWQMSSHVFEWLGVNV